MQKRHQNRYEYFCELANTSRRYYLDYLRQYVLLDASTKVLEVGCGEGGNLLPFAEVGCKVTGIDLSDERVRQATEFFARAGHKGNFVASDFLKFNDEHHRGHYNVIIAHDVIEHIERKEEFVEHLKFFLADGGIIFWRFPAWQMPFGGHQQICRNRLCAMFPFVHLLPESGYRWLLQECGESEACIRELMSIKRCGVTIEGFEDLVRKHRYSVICRTLWFVNPHYEQKFDIRPLRLPRFISDIPHLRNFVSTSCYYLTTSAG